MLEGKRPKCGGANGSIRFRSERAHEANKGLSIAVLMLQKVKFMFQDISYADIYQMASATAIELAGGPVIPMRYGRVDAGGSEAVLPEGNLPKAAAPFPNSAWNASTHLRSVFYRMGLNDKDIVALSGGHTLGRAYIYNSGFGKALTKYTMLGPGMLGGMSWTPNWLHFDNSYYKHVKEARDVDLLILETDAALFEDHRFRVYAEQYMKDNDAFLRDYAISHAKLSELGVQWAHGGPVSL